MNDNARGRDDRSLQRLISGVLRGGVLLSAGLILLGALALVARALAGQAASTDAFPSTLGGVLAGVARGDGVAIMALGLLVLLATPVARICLSLVAFALERDWLYIAITALVLAIIVASFLLGRAGS